MLKFLKKKLTQLVMETNAALAAEHDENSSFSHDKLKVEHENNDGGISQKAIVPFNKTRVQS